MRERITGVATDDRVYFFVALDRDTECRYAFVLDLTAQRAGRGTRWYLEEYSHGIRDACLWSFSTQTICTTWALGNQTAPLVVTEYGFVGILGVGFRDLVDPQLTATGTATGGSTTTLIDTGATFTRTNESSLTSDVVGAYMTIVPAAPASLTISGSRATAARVGAQAAYDPVRITGVSGTTITFTPAVPNAVAAGATYVIGGIPNVIYKTPLMAFGMARARKKSDKAVMEFQPGGHNYTVGFGTIKDRRGPDEITTAQTEDPYSATAGATVLSCDMGGELEEDCRVGVQKLRTRVRAVNYLLMFLDASGVDKPAIVDSLTVSLKEIVGV